MKLLVLAACAACAAAPRPVITELPRDAMLIDPDAAAARFAPLERYRGHVVVLDVWAGWCVECRAMTPQVDRLAAAFAEDGLVVVGVDAGEPAADAIRYARDLGITYPIALDPDLTFAARVDAANLPVLLVIDPTGAIVHRSRHLDEPTLAAIRRLLHR